jgi:hypothetical protein
MLLPLFLLEGVGCRIGRNVGGADGFWGKSCESGLLASDLGIVPP